MEMNEISEMETAGTENKTQVKTPVKKTPAKKTSKKNAKAKSMAEKKDDKLDIAVFFTTTREREGIRYELKIHNIGIGVEVLLYGPSSKQKMLASEKYEAAMKKLEESNLPEEQKSAEREKALVERAVDVIGGLYMKDGSPVIENGKEMKDYKKTALKLFFENTDIRDDLLAASLTSITFMR